jgi:hypothetical protein
MEKCCFLVGQKDSLFKQLVASLLSDLAINLKLAESRSTGFEDLLNEISVAEPNLILLEEASPFSGDSYLIQLLINVPNIPVIVISEASNEMHILRRESVILSSSSDLIKTIDQIQKQPETLGTP